MKDYLTVLRDHIHTHPPDLGDADSVLNLLFEAYSEIDPMEDAQIKAGFHKLYQLMNGVRWRRWARSSIQCVSCSGSTSGQGLYMECRSECCLHRNWRNRNWPGAVLAPGLAYLVRYA